MAKTRQPLEVVMAKGKTHLTKAQIAERQKTEIKPITDEIVAPEHLTDAQKETFYKLAGQLAKLKIMGETDVDTLGRYVECNEIYVNTMVRLREINPVGEPDEYFQLERIQGKYFEQVRKCASDLGLTISSRCKLVIPATSEEEAPPNKFKKFEKQTAIGQ